MSTAYDLLEMIRGQRAEMLRFLRELVRAATGRAGDPHDQLRHRLRHQLPAARAARAVVCGDQRRCTVLGADTQTWWPSEALCGQPAPRRLRRLGRGSTAEAA